MARPITLFTGQWADLPIEKVCEKALSFGFDGIELACWGDHLEVDKADQAYCDARRKLLDQLRDEVLRDFLSSGGPGCLRSR